MKNDLPRHQSMEESWCSSVLRRAVTRKEPVSLKNFARARKQRTGPVSPGERNGRRLRALP